jgi:hypothetical protein
MKHIVNEQIEIKLTMEEQLFIQWIAEQDDEEYVEKLKTLFYTQLGVEQDLRLEDMREDVFERLDEEQAKTLYFKGVAIYAKKRNGTIEQITPSHYYGSHATAEELFYRGLADFRKDVFYRFKEELHE